MDGGRDCIPGWRIVREIGKGSFGTVYEIEKEGDFGSEVRSALKVISIPESSSEIAYLRNEGYDESSMTELFKSRVEDITSEFRLMNKLKGSSNVVNFEDFLIIQHDDDPGYDVMIRMELLTPLPDYINRQFPRGEITSKAVIDLGVDMCRALELCRHYGVIHRDIKPQNIFVNAYGIYKLGDFGIAKVSDHTTKATKTGTFGYMAPEVYLSKPYNATVDIYSLGLVLYWMLNERRGPFLPLPPVVPKSAQSVEALERRMAGEPLPAPKHGSEALKRIVLKACAFDPKDRYANPTEMKRDLEHLTDTDQSEAADADRTVSKISSFSTTEADRTVCLIGSDPGQTGIFSDEKTSNKSASSTVQQWKFCLRCGSHMKSGNRFCPACGADQSPISDQKQSSIDPIVEKKKPAGSGAQQERQKAKPIFLISILASVLVLTAVVLMFVFLGKDKCEENDAKFLTASPSTVTSTPTTDATKKETPSSDEITSSVVYTAQLQESTNESGDIIVIMIDVPANTTVIISLPDMDDYQYYNSETKAVPRTVKIPTSIFYPSGASEGSSFVISPEIVFVTADGTEHEVECPSIVYTIPVSYPDTPVSQPPETTNPFAAASVWDTITFGSYPWTADEEEKPIEWIVLAKESDRILVLSKYALDSKVYHTYEGDRPPITWEQCELRSWLNHDFLSKAFDADEQKLILTETVPADRNPEHPNVDPGNDTLDTVFLLSVKEFNRYLNNKPERFCFPTEFAIEQGADTKDADGRCWWWLRSPGHTQTAAVIVSKYDGEIDVNYIGNSGVGIRPAMWLACPDE